MVKSKKNKKINSFIKSSYFFGILILTAIMFLGIGYAQISGVTLTISGTAKTAGQRGFLISDISYVSDNNANVANSKINTYYQTMMDSTINLNNDPNSSITYQVTIVNSLQEAKTYSDTIYDDSFYDNSDITFEVTGISPGEAISPGQTKTFNITFKYAEVKANYENTILNSYLNFKFEDPIPTTSALKTGSDINSTFVTLAGGRGNIKQIVYATDDQYNNIKNSLDDSNIISSSSSETDAYAWYSNNTIYYYSEANKIVLNANSSGMFNNMSQVTSIDTTKFNTSGVTNMNSMFYNCSALTELNLSSFNTSNVTDMYGMFYGCSGLTELNISNFNTSEVTNMASMFGNINVTSLDLSNFNTEKVTKMENMFNGAKSLTSLNVTSFDVSNVKTMSRMFASCESLTELDLSSFSPVQATTLEKMLSNMYALVTIYASDNFITTSASNSNGMFVNDTNLVGGNGTVYDANNVNKTYAVIDTATTPGYFTRK